VDAWSVFGVIFAFVMGGYAVFFSGHFTDGIRAGNPFARRYQSRRATQAVVIVVGLGFLVFGTLMLLDLLS
jgi:hypothetical protein